LYSNLLKYIFSAQTYTPLIGPFTDFLPPCGGVISSMLSNNFVKIVRSDNVNRYWREIGAVNYVTLESNKLPNWNLQDLPVITIPHPDKEKLGAPFLEELNILGKEAIDQGESTRINKISDLTLGSDEKTPILFYENDDKNLQRIAIRNLGGKEEINCLSL
jgi:hypothetical protein